MKTSKKVLFVTLAILALLYPALRAGPGFAEDAPGDDLITVNLVNVEISSLVRIMSEITGKNFIFDEGLKGKITIVAPVKLSADEAFTLFISALELKNFAVVRAGKAYKILPSSQARQNAARVVKGLKKVRLRETFIVRLIPLRYVSTQEAFAFVQPLVSRFGQISVFGSRNALLVVDTSANTDKIVDIIAAIDTEPLTDEPEVVFLKHAKAETVARLLKLEVKRSGISPRGGVKPGDDGISADLRLNAVVLSGRLSTRENLKKFIAVLDIPSPETSSRINVYYLENAEAVKLSAVLEKLTKPTAPGPRQEPDSKISITPDEFTNSLIIMASPADYQGLVQVIKKLDKRPRQVFVEAMITEVSVDKALALGTKWRLTGVAGGEPIAIGGFGNVDQSAIQTIINGMAGVSVGGLGNFITIPVTKADGSTFNLTAPGFAALFSMSQFKDVVNVLSTPHILTSDNSEAEIIVGENVPFLSAIERNTTSPSQPLLQSIERKDVGITLRIKPKISEGGFVKLDIYQEISAIATTTTAGAADLITTKRSAKTTVVVRDRQTVIIGGLIQNKKITNINRVPFISRIPIIGWLFKFKTDTSQKTNLLVFITPYIIDDFGTLEDIKKKKEQEFREGTVDESYKKRKAEDVPEDLNTAPTKRKIIEAEPARPVETVTTADPVPEAATQAITSDILDVRTGIHERFHRLVVELSGEIEYSIIRRGDSRLSIRMRGVGSRMELKKNLSTDIITVQGITVAEDDRGPVTTLDVGFKEGAGPRNSTRQDPFRIVIDFYP